MQETIICTYIAKKNTKENKITKKILIILYLESCNLFFNELYRYTYSELARVGHPLRVEINSNLVSHRDDGLRRSCGATTLP